MSSKDKHSLQTIIEAISKIHRFTKGHSDPDNFNEDDKAFDAVMMNFILIGEMVSRISSNTKKANPQIDWNRIKGFRNLVEHDYFGIDAEEVWQIIVNDLPILKKEIDKIP
jgi:uncharacterized protein with HEPN domain